MGSIWPCQMWIFLRQILIAQPWELCVPSLCGVPEAVSTPAGYFWCSLYAAGVWPCYLKACHLKSPNKAFPGYLGGEIRGFSLDLNLQRNVISGAEARDKYLLFSRFHYLPFATKLVSVHAVFCALPYWYTSWFCQTAKRGFVSGDLSLGGGKGLSKLWVKPVQVREMTVQYI